MHSRLIAVTYDAQSPGHLARFWGGMLGREPVDDADGMLLPGADGQLSLRFVASDTPPQPRHRMHLHLTSDSPLDQQRTVTAALEIGATHLDVQSPQGGTKVSWGGEPRSSRQGPDWQRFELVVDGDQDAEIERLIGLGARRLGDVRPGLVLLADPDGTQFRVRQA